ncbi:hypothetical protein DL770_008849 [Monosporascus sp. CRB-9-2]|nr:hypothetical protein DL770_008849 [Monosporascus sp. CRB-9-2]
MFHTATTPMRPADYTKLRAKELKKKRSPTREAKLRERERENFLKNWKVPGVSPDSPGGQAMIEAHLERWAEKREKDFYRRAEQKALRQAAEKLEREERKKNKKGPTQDDLLLKEAREEALDDLLLKEAREEGLEGGGEALEEAMHQSER